MIRGYGGGRFRIAGETYEGSVLVFAERTLPWPVTEAAQVTPRSLEEATGAAERPDILLVGCGPRFVAEPAGLRAALREAGAVLGWLDTGAACRPFNVLLAEDRRAAAALIAVE